MTFKHLHQDHVDSRKLTGHIPIFLNTEFPPKRYTKKWTGFSELTKALCYIFFPELFIINTSSVFNYLRFLFSYFCLGGQHMSQEDAMGLVWNDSLHDARKFQSYVPRLFPLMEQKSNKGVRQEHNDQEKALQCVQGPGRETLWVRRVRRPHGVLQTQVIWPSFLLKTAHSHLQLRCRHSRAVSVCQRCCFTRFKLQA